MVNQSIRRRLLDLLVPGSFLEQFYRVGREVIKNNADFFSFINTQKSKYANSREGGKKLTIFWLVLKYILKPYF